MSFTEDGVSQPFRYCSDLTLLLSLFRGVPWALEDAVVVYGRALVLTPVSILVLGTLSSCEAVHWKERLL